MVVTGIEQAQQKRRSRGNGKLWWKSVAPQTEFNKHDKLTKLKPEPMERTLIGEFNSSLSLPQTDTGSSSDGSGCMKTRTSAESLSRDYASMKLSNKRVRFSTVHFHVHALVLGDNPSVSSGPPLTISWQSEYSASVPLDDYEEQHPDRRVKDSLLVPRSLREDWLREEGYSRGELKAAELAAMAVKARRQKAFNQDKFFHGMERTAGAMLRWTSTTPRAALLPAQKA